MLTQFCSSPSPSWLWRFHGERNRSKSIPFFTLYKLVEYLIIFLVGANVYCGIEILWRGYTHWTMGIVGGVALIIVGILNEGILPQKWGIIPQSICGGLIITVMELIAGVILNLWLKLDIWDYSQMWCNLWGQICLLYTFLWMCLSAVAIFVDDLLRHFLFKERWPHYDLWLCKHTTLYH